MLLSQRNIGMRLIWALVPALFAGLDEAMRTLSRKR